MLLAVAMKKHRGVFAVLKELALVLLCLKPAVELWHLTHGGKHDPGAPVDPKVAMIFGKVIERAFESIPSSILMTVALLNHADTRSPSNMASVIDSSSRAWRRHSS